MHVDMVVSTSDALESRFPMLVVHPVLTDDDIIRLIRFSKKVTVQIVINLPMNLKKRLLNMSRKIVNATC